MRPNKKHCSQGRTESTTYRFVGQEDETREKS